MVGFEGYRFIYVGATKLSVPPGVQAEYEGSSEGKICHLLRVLRFITCSQHDRSSAPWGAGCVHTPRRGKLTRISNKYLCFAETRTRRCRQWRSIVFETQLLRPRACKPGDHQSDKNVKAPGRDDTFSSLHPNKISGLVRGGGIWTRRCSFESFKHTAPTETT